MVYCTLHGPLIALKIFKYLSQKDVFNCRKVCKIWKHLIDTDMFWLRLHIDNIYQVIKKSEVYTKYMYLANHTNAKGTPFKVMEIFPDLKDLFDKALNQNRKVTEELIPQLKYYYKKTAVINHRFQHPVHYAAQNGDIELMKLLHDQCQADCNVKDRLRKCIPIHMACHYSHLQMVDYLLEHLTNKVYFKSTFIIACEQPNIQILEKLVEYAKDKCIKIDARKHIPKIIVLYLDLPSRFLLLFVESESPAVVGIFYLDLDLHVICSITLCLSCITFLLL